MRHTLSLIALLALHFPAMASTVVLDGRSWHELVDEPETPEVELPGPRAVERDVRLTPVDEGWELEARWRVVTEEPGWFEAHLLGPGAHVSSITWDGSPAPVGTEAEGSRLVGWVDGEVVIELTAFVPGAPGSQPLQLAMHPAVRGAVHVDEADLEAVVSASEDGLPLVRLAESFVGAPEQFAVDLAPPASALGARSTLAVAHAAVGLTVGDAELRGRARLSWEVRQGHLDTVSFQVDGVGSDLEVTGANLRSWRRSGGRVEVVLQEPVTDALVLELSWSTGVPGGIEGRLPVPTIRPEGAFRTESALQLARDGEVEVVPSLQRWQAVASTALPTWAGGLIEGTATASYTASGSGSGTIGLFRFEPVSGPPLVVDVAAFTLATSAEGRTLTKVHYEVRNERASHLRIVPPEGSRIIGVRVGGESALPVTDGHGGWLVPLLRSVETVEGLLSFPVEVALLGEGTPWDRKEERRIGLPVVDAPVAVARLTLYLPPGYGSLLDDGERRVVDAFTEGEGITYGFAVGDVGAVEAEQLFQDAVAAWMGNDFDQAQDYLDELGEMGAENPNITRLQSNLDVLEGRDTGGDVDVTLERRVREQARARAAEEERAQIEYKRQAEESMLAGDYEEAEELLREAQAIGQDLAKLEQSESVEVESRNASIDETLEVVEAEKKRRGLGRADSDHSGRSSASVSLFGKAKEVEGDEEDEEDVYHFEDEDIDGDLITIDGTEITILEPEEAATPYPFAGEYWFDDAPTDDTGVADSREAQPQVVTGATRGETPLAMQQAGQGQEPGWLDAGEADTRVLWGQTVTGGGEEGELGNIVTHGTPSSSTAYGTGIGTYGTGVSGGGSAGVSYGSASSSSYGVAGGVVGGEIGSLAGAAAPVDSPPPEPSPDPEPEPEWGATEVDLASADYESVSESRPRLRLPMPRMPGKSGKKKKDKNRGGSPAPPSESGPTAGPSGDAMTFDLADDAVDTPAAVIERLPEPEVTASALSVTIPVAGEAVRYQQLLLPADTAPEVVIHARLPRSRSSKSKRSEP